MTSDNLTNIIVAIVAALGVILSARIAKRKPDAPPPPQSDVDRLRLRLSECEAERDHERELFFREREKWLQGHLARHNDLDVSD